MDSYLKNILVIDLAKKEADLKTFTDLKEYIGGVGVGTKLYSLYEDQKPLIFSIGPLNGFFPFASKTSIILNSEDGIEDLYLGGSLSYRMRFAGIDSIMFLGKSKSPVVIDIMDGNVTFHDAEISLGTLGLPGKRSTLSLLSKLTLDEYFEPPEDLLEKEFYNKKIKGIVITGTKSYEVSDFEKYSELYKKILEKSSELSISKSDKPSCSGCPMGCDFSRTGEIGGNILVHCMVGCSYAQNVYSDVGTIFSCLNVLGYDYTHEDLENAPKKISEIFEQIS